MKKTLLLCMTLFGALALNAQMKLSPTSKNFIKKGEQTTLSIQKMEEPIKSFGIKKNQTLSGDATTQEEENVMDSKVLTFYPPTVKTVGYGTISMNRNGMSFASIFEGPLVERFVGNTITNVIFIPSSGASSIDVWIRKDLGGVNLWETTLAKGEYEEETPISVECNYVIDGDFILGCTVYPASLLGGKVQVFFSPEVLRDYSFIYDAGNGWVDASISGAIYFGCVTSGEGGLADDDVELTAINPTERSRSGSTFNFPGVFTNYGAYPVQSYKVAASVNGKVTEMEFETKEPVGYLETYNFDVPVAFPAKSGRYSGSMEITQVNGSDDGYLKDNSLNNEFISIDDSYKRKAVIEEVTGTWCGYCPPGIIALEKLDKDYPDDCINIAVHGYTGTNDPFMADTYSGLYDAGFGFPTAIVNRMIAADPYLGFGNAEYGITQVIDMINAIPSEAALALTSKLSADKKTLDITTSVLFGLDNPTCPYSIAYVLTEDGLTGVAQTNYYSSEAGMVESAEDLPEDLMPLFNEAYNYYPTFNHVARQINDLNGIENSLSGAIKKEEMKTHTYTLTLPNTIESLDNTTLVAMLIDNLSGEVVTAIKAKLGESVTGIADINAAPGATINVDANGVAVTAENATAYIYTVAGQLVYSGAVNGTATLPTAGMKGVHIVKVVKENDVVVKRVML